MKMIKWFVETLPERFRWAPHNLISHPLSEIVDWFGLYDLAVIIHDSTVPEEFNRPDKGEW